MAIPFLSDAKFSRLHKLKFHTTGEITTNGASGNLFDISAIGGNTDLRFLADNDEGSSSVYFLLDASMADYSYPAYYTRFPDNSHLVFGDSANTTALDFEIYHEGTTAYLQGDSDIYIYSEHGDITINGDSGIELRHSNGRKFHTTTTGVDVTGTINLDNLTINGAQGTDGQVLTSTGSGIAWEDASGGASLSGGEASKVAVWSATDTLTHNDNFHFDTTNVRLGIGDSNPNRTLVVSETRTGSTASDAYTAIVKSVQSSGASPNPGTGGLKVQYTSSSSNVHAFGLVAGSSSSDFLTTGPMHFYTNSDLDTVSATGFAMQLDTSQRLILGSMTASQKLNVSGNVTADRYYGNGSTVYYVDPNDSTTSAILNGKVGIGMASSPISKFQVVDAAFPQVRINDETNGGESGIRFRSKGTGVDLHGDIFVDGTGSETGRMGFRIPWNGTEKMTILSSGNVGIGTTSPSQKLEVNGTVKGDEFVSLVNTSNSGITRDWTRIGTGDRGAGLEVGDISGARYAIYAGGYDLTFGKHVSSNNTYTTAMAIYAADATDSSPYVQATHSLRAPIFYDSNDTNYYLNPNGTSIANTITLGRINMKDMGDYITFYGNDNNHHSISSRDNNGNASDDLRINSYHNVYFNLDSNNNNNNDSTGIYVGQHGSGSSAIQNAWSFYSQSDGVTFTSGSFRAPIFYDSGNTNFNWDPNTDNSHRFTTASGYLDIGPKNTSWCHLYTDRNGFYFNKTTFQLNGNQVWHAGNDGSGSGLDADLLDGVQGANYFKKGADIGGSQDLNNYTTDGYYHQNANANASSGSNYPVGAAGMLSVVSDGSMVYQTYHQYNGNAYYHRSYYNGTWYAWRKVWQDGNDGSGSGLDADTVDGIQGGSFLRSDANDSFTGDELHFPTLDLSISNNNSQNNGNTYFRGTGTHFVLGLNNGNTCYLNYGNSSGALRLYGSSIYWNDSNIGSPWGSANDGSGSGLDADLLDGSHKASFLYDQGSGDFRYNPGGSISSLYVGQTPTTGTGSSFINFVKQNYSSMPGAIYFYISPANTTNSTSSTYLKHIFRHDGDAYHDGDVVAYSTSTGSDKKLKKNIRDLEGALDKTLKLRGVKFDWKDENKANDQLGFIAQEVENVIPEVVKEVKTVSKDDETHLTVNYPALVPLLTEAIKEQQAQINELKTTLEKLTKQLNNGSS